MLRSLKLAGLTLFLAVFAVPVLAAEPLVDTGWVKNNLGRPGVVFLDVTSNPGAYAKGHVPGAVYTHYKKDKWRVDGKKNGRKVSGVLPPVDHMEKLVGRLGIGNDDHVVIIANGSGPAEMGTATRLYWTFLVLGHDNVSIMDGGMRAWVKDKANPLETAANKPTAKTFKADFRDELIATTDEVKAAMKDGTTLIDSRPVAQNLGVTKSSKVRAFGTIPGAISVPGEYMTFNNGGQLRNSGSLAKLYELSSAPTTGKSITFCNTGHWASLGWFSEYALLGNKESAMYDGSLAEWTTDDGAPMQRKVNLD
jgi:thiosulfate/3-mercaptopyruvate sulfurtransferase